MASANLFAQYLQPVRSMQDRMAEYDAADLRREQLAGVQRQNRLQELAFQRGEEERAGAAAEASALRALAQEAGGDESKFAAALRRSGKFAQANEIEKARNERLKGETETLDKRLGIYKSAADQLQDRNQALGWLQSQFNDPLVGPLIQSRGRFEDLAANIPDSAADPEGFNRWRMASSQGLSKVQEQFAPKPVTVNLGGRQVVIDQNPNSPTFGKELQSLVVSNPATDKLVFDPKTGSYVINEPLVQANERIGRASASKTVVDMTGGQKGFENETKLRDNFKQEPVYKAHQEMESAHRQIIEAINKKSPIGDMAAATKIMKLLDPGSVVRESELGMAMQATGMMDYLTNYAQNIINGTKLTPTQRKEFAELADALYSQSVEQYDKKRGEYIKLGSEYGLNSERALGAVARTAPAARPKPTKGEAKPAATPAVQPFSDAEKERRYQEWKKTQPGAK